MGLEGFREENPVSESNYKELLGDYRLAEKLRCCIQTKQGNLCHTKHNYGFVVRLKDDSASIIGNQCANDKFDAKSRVMQDRARFLNAQNRQKARERIAELLIDKELSVNAIQLAHDDLIALEGRLHELRARFGDPCWNQLTRMATGGGPGTVAVQGVRKRIGKRDDGSTYTERSGFGISVGTIAGIGLLNTYRVRELKERLRSIKFAYGEAEKLTEDSKTTDIEKHASKLGDLPAAIQACNDFTALENTFMQSDWTPMLFLVRTDSDRAKLGRVVLEQKGTPGGRDKAKQLIQALEQQLRTTHGVDEIVMQM